MPLLIMIIAVVWAWDLKTHAVEPSNNFRLLQLADVQQYWINYLQTGETALPAHIQWNLTDQASDFLVQVLVSSNGQRSLVRHTHSAVDFYARDKGKSFRFWTKFILQLSQIGRPLMEYVARLIQYNCDVHHRHFLQQILQQALRLNQVGQPQESIIQQLARTAPDLYQRLITKDFQRLMHTHPYERYAILKLQLIIFALPLEQAPWDLFTREQLALYLGIMERSFDRTITQVLPWIYRTINLAYFGPIPDPQRQSEFLALTPQMKVLLLRLAHQDKYQQPPAPVVAELTSNINALLVELLKDQHISSLPIPQMRAFVPILHNNHNMEQAVLQQLGPHWHMGPYGLYHPTDGPSRPACQAAALKVI